LHKARHIKGVAKLIEYTELSDCFVIIMERKVEDIKGYCKDLFDFITDQHKNTGHGIHEDLAKKIYKQVVQTILDLDNADILHGDIKDENILIDVKTNEVKLIDFGAGNKKFDEKLYKTYHGTRVYSPPEWIESKFYTSSSLNVWSLGVLLFNMLTGDVPFKKDSSILEAQVRFPITAPLSNSVQDLIRKCLTPSMKNRIKLQDILNHQWFSLTENNNNMHSSLPRVSGNGNIHENSNFRSQNQQDTETNQISIYLQPVSSSSSLSSEGPCSIPTQSTEINISGNGNCHEEKSNIRSKIQLPTGNTQISSLKSITSLVILESQIETMVMHSCHKQPFFKKLLKLLTLPITFLLSGIRSGCIVGDMV
jgi:serine/threonine protein kinase